jgi:hypothetical protein
MNAGCPGPGLLICVRRGMPDSLPAPYVAVRIRPGRGTIRSKYGDISFG